MRIVIISDIHDNLANLGLFLKKVREENISEIICCGDVCNLETASYLNNNFPNKINLVRGNMELYEDKNLSVYKNINYLGRYGSIEINNIKMGICHEPDFINNLLRENKQLDFIFYGHTHKPWISEKNKTTLINPGTLGGVFQKASFAIFDTTNKKAKLIIL